MVFAGKADDEPVTMTCTILRLEATSAPRAHPPGTRIAHALGARARRHGLHPAAQPRRPRRPGGDRQLLPRRAPARRSPGWSRASPAGPSRGTGTASPPPRRTTPASASPPRWTRRERARASSSCGCRTSCSRPTATAPARARASSGPSATPTRPSWRRGRARRRAGPTAPTPAAPAASTTTSPATSPTTSAPRSWAQASSAPRRVRGRTSSGRAGGATSRRSTPRSSCSPTTSGPRFSLSDTTFHFIDADPHDALRQAKAAADGKDVRLGGGVATVREFLEADLVDTMHVAVAPVELGRGGRLWDSPDDLLDRFHLERIPSPSGVTHHLFWRR